VVFVYGEAGQHQIDSGLLELTEVAMRSQLVVLVTQGACPRLFNKEDAKTPWKTAPESQECGLELMAGLWEWRGIEWAPRGRQLLDLYRG
jgi:hypothetical protein